MGVTYLFPMTCDAERFVINPLMPVMNDAIIVSAGTIGWAFVGDRDISR